jgi:hypothetical protein
MAGAHADGGTYSRSPGPKGPIGSPSAETPICIRPVTSLPARCVTTIWLKAHSSLSGSSQSTRSIVKSGGSIWPQTGYAGVPYTRRYKFTHLRLFSENL